MKTTKALPMSLLTAALMTFAAGASGQEIVPITATLPIKVVGDSCTELNLGTTANPNLIAAEGVAITADRASLLTCQSGVWGKQVSSESDGLYLCNSGSAVNFWTVCVEKSTGKLINSYYSGVAVVKGERNMSNWPVEWANGQTAIGCNLDNSNGSLITACQERNSTKVCVAYESHTAWRCYNW